MSEVFKVKVEGIAGKGAGFARIGGKSVFIEGSAAGETVCCRIAEDHGSWARAELLEIVETSPDRVEPACAFYGVCGGCNLQHLSYETQVAAKIVILKDNFARIGGFNPPEPEVIPSPPWEYRNRMQFHRIDPNRTARVRPAQHRLSTSEGTEHYATFGLKARKSEDIVPVADCPIADPGIRSLLQQTASQQTALGEAAFPLPLEKDRFTVYARDGLLLSEGGKQRGRIRLLEKEIALDAGVFFQSNGLMLEKLIEDLREIAAGADRGRAFADLYCGVGTFAAFLGDLFPKTDLVEENKSALALARENIKGTETEFFALRDDDWAKLQERRRGVTGGSTAGSGKAAHYGFIVADPPRQGLSAPLARWLAAEGPPLLAYVSCDPATLARDSKILTLGGYELAALKLYDFYPQTAHIESLAVFNKN
ncbi:putative RNA methyltransferase [Spirochaetia bacterium]|nr:putative RNA methyltransferase [Spirochaetia bacterium]